MKKHLLSFALLLLLGTQTKAQTSVYHPFPEDTATWLSDQYSNMCSGYCSSVFYEMEGDTIIKSQSYNKIYVRNGLFYYINPNPDYSASFSACSYTGAVRQDSINKKVYFIDSTMTTDTLLYDFNLAVGDTIQYWYNRGWTPFPLVVSGIDSVLINGSYRKRFNFQNFVSDQDESLIEGVGWTGDLLLGLLYSGDGAISLACFDGTGGGEFINECAFALDCSISVGINEQSESKDLILSPHPANNQLTIHTSSFNNKAVTISVMNVLGQNASSPTPLQRRGEDSVIDVSGLAAGMYFLQLNSESESVVRKFVKE